jgi:hypothetical protein
MGNDVSITMSSKDQDVIRSLQRIAAGVEKVSDKFVQLQRKSRASGGGGFAGGIFGNGGFSKLAANLGGAVAGYVTVGRAIEGVMGSNRRFIDQTDEARIRYDELFRMFAGQSGLRGLEATAAENNIKREAIRSGLEIERVASTATQLVSSGFSAKEAAGSSLKELLDVFVASNLVGQKEMDFGQLAQSFSMYLSAQKLDKNGANILEVGKRVQALFKFTNLQFADFAEFAARSSSLSSVMSIPEQLSAISVLRDVAPGEESATYLGRVVTDLRTAAGSDSKIEALKKLNLKPADVDMVGEDFHTAFTRLHDALQAAPEELRPIAMFDLFGKRGQDFADVLLGALGKFKENLDAQMRSGEFEADVALGQSGPAALARRQKELRDQLTQKLSNSGTALLDQMDNNSLASGEPAWLRDLDRMKANILRYLGVDPATAARIAHLSDEKGAIAEAQIKNLSGPNPLSDEEVRTKVQLERGDAELQKRIDAAKAGKYNMDAGGTFFQAFDETINATLNNRKRNPKLKPASTILWEALWGDSAKGKAALDAAGNVRNLEAGQAIEDYKRQRDRAAQNRNDLLEFGIDPSERDARDQADVRDSADRARGAINRVPDPGFQKRFRGQLDEEVRKNEASRITVELSRANEINGRLVDALEKLVAQNKTPGTSTKQEVALRIQAAPEAKVTLASRRLQRNPNKLNA